MNSMSTVDKVIFDALAKRQNIVLPGIGSLEVKRRKAKKNFRRSDNPPAKCGGVQSG